MSARSPAPPSAMAAPSLPAPPAAGFYCSTSGTVLSDRDSLSQHYKSEFHRYNLKRKVAGLPPVTKEWFEARREQLLGQAQGGGGAGEGAAAAGLPPGHVRLWCDPLTRRTFRSEQTWATFVRSNKYQELVRKTGEPAPEPTIVLRKAGSSPADEPGQQPPTDDGNRAAPRGAQGAGGPGFHVVSPSGGLPLKREDAPEPSAAASTAPSPILEGGNEGTEVEEGDEDGWETVSEEEALDGTADGEEDWEQWDVRRSLFDNHMSTSFEANLEYMWRKYGFYFPDAQYLRDPEGLLQYLGAKLQHGRVPLYTRGDDAGARQFRSLHAVQRHMVDSGRCKLAYDDNEEEYEEFYDFGEEAEAEEGEEEEEEAEAQAAVQDGAANGREVAVSGSGPVVSVAPVTAGYELAVGLPGGTAKVLGSREFARYYRQRHRPVDDRAIVVVNTMLAKYRALGISLLDDAATLAAKKARSKTRKDVAWDAKRRQGLFMRGNVNLNLPKNVPY